MLSARKCDRSEPIYTRKKKERVELVSFVRDALFGRGEREIICTCLAGLCVNQFGGARSRRRDARGGSI